MLSAWVYATSGASAGKSHVVGVDQQGPYEGLSSPDADDNAKGAAYAAVAEAVPSAVASAMAASTAAAAAAAAGTAAQAAMAQAAAEAAAAEAAVAAVPAFPTSDPRAAAPFVPSAVPSVPEAETEEEQGRERGCRSHSETATAEWCDLTCKATPDTDDCLTNCRCPGWTRARSREGSAVQREEENKQMGKCNSLADTVSADWCEGSCAPTPNADECWDTCNCPGRKKTKPEGPAVPEPSPNPLRLCTTTSDVVSDLWCEQNCLDNPDAEMCLEEGCTCPGRDATESATAAPKQFDAAESAEAAALCKSLLDTAPWPWCDTNCLGSPEADQCKQACLCPETSRAPTRKQSDKTSCRSVVLETATDAWCDDNCKADPNAEWCYSACRCPGYDASVAAERVRRERRRSRAQKRKLKAEPLPSAPPPPPWKCESLVGTASSSWCDTNCLDTPMTDACRAACKCPGLLE